MRDVRSACRLRAFLAVLLAASAAFALPTKREVAAARSDVENVLSSTLKLHRSGKMEPERLAKMLLLLAQGEDDEARRFLYLQGTAVAAVEALDVPLAAQALARLRSDISLMSPEVEGQVLDLALRQAPKGRAARLRLDILRRTETPVLRVGTYDLRFGTAADGANAWTNRCGAFAGTLRKLDLDVFGLQEVKPDQAAFLRTALPVFASVGETRETDRTDGTVSPVFYRKDRFDTEKAGSFRFGASPRVCSFLVLRDRATGRLLSFANTRIGEMPTEARDAAVCLVLERMRTFAAEIPVVLVDDLNGLSPGVRVLDRAPGDVRIPAVATVALEGRYR